MKHLAHDRRIILVFVRGRTDGSRLEGDVVRNERARFLELIVTADAFEQSIGGAFSINGAADVYGCDRIISQYLLKHYPAPPVSPVARAACAPMP